MPVNGKDSARTRDHRILNEARAQGRMMFIFTSDDVKGHLRGRV